MSIDWTLPRKCSRCGKYQPTNQRICLKCKAKELDDELKALAKRIEQEEVLESFGIGPAPWDMGSDP